MVFVYCQILPGADFSRFLCLFRPLSAFSGPTHLNELSPGISIRLHCPAGNAPPGDGDGYQSQYGSRLW